MEDKDIQLITQRFDALIALMNTQFSAINARLDKINGRVGKTEDEIQMALIERATNRQQQEDKYKEIEDMKVQIQDIDNKERNHVAVCPIVTPMKEIDKRVRVLEDVQIATVSKSGLIKSAIAMLAVIVSITVGMMKITENHAEAQSLNIRMAQDTMMSNQAVIYRELLKIIDENKKDTIK